MTQFYLGVDTSKGYADFCLTDAAGAVLPGSQRYDDTPAGHRAVRELCLDLLATHPDAQLCVGLEASGGLERNWLRLFRDLLFRDLLPDRGRVYQLNPLVVKRYLERDLHRNVTDPRSARGISAYLREGLRPADRPHQPLLEGQRTLYRCVLNAQGRATQLQNELHSLLPSVQPELVAYCRQGFPHWVLLLLARYPTADALSRARPATLARLPYVTATRAAALIAAAKTSVASLRDPHTATVVGTLAKQLLAAERQIEQLKHRLSTELAADGEVQLLCSIPGIGLWTAVALRLEYGSLAAFHSAAAVVAFAGLDPRWHQSGDQEWRLGISRRGHPQIRGALYMATLAAIRCNPVLEAFYAGLRARGKAHLVALTACMAKLLRLAYACVVRQQPFDLAHYRAVQARHQGATGTAAPGVSPAATAETGGTAEPVVGALTAPVSRREAQRRRAATAPQVGGAPRVRGHGAALTAHDSASPGSCPRAPAELAQTP